MKFRIPKFDCKLVCAVLIVIAFIMGTTDIGSRTNCIFCNIVNRLDNTVILYEDEDICIFQDIKPASKYHTLTIPKRHIQDVKSLTSADKDLLTKMLAAAKQLLLNNNLTVESARFGYHWPPFRSVKHLHLHTISPFEDMGFMDRLIFRKDSYWFVSPEYVQSLL